MGVSVARQIYITRWLKRGHVLEYLIYVLSNMESIVVRNHMVISSARTFT